MASPNLCPVRLALVPVASRLPSPPRRRAAPPLPRTDCAVRVGRRDHPTIITKAVSARAASSGQDVEASRALVQVLLAAETLDRLVSWQDVADQTGLSRSRAYALLREERTQLVAGNGHQPTLHGTAS
jgi:hypothetical protein